MAAQEVSPVPYRFDSLDPDVRRHMVAEINQDIENGRVHLSDLLTDAGREAWPNLLWEAAESHNDGWLAAQLRRHSYVTGGNEPAAAAPRGKGNQGGKPADDPGTILAECEFNRLYIRGVCADVLAKGKQDVEICKGLPAGTLSSEASCRVGKKVPARKLLNSIRNNPDVESSLGAPSGTVSGLTVKR